jgi:hypothetical protein
MPKAKFTTKLKLNYIENAEIEVAQAKLNEPSDFAI